MEVELVADLEPGDAPRIGASCSHALSRLLTDRAPVGSVRVRADPTLVVRISVQVGDPGRRFLGSSLFERADEQRLGADAFTQLEELGRAVARPVGLAPEAPEALVLEEGDRLRGALVHGPDCLRPVKGVRDRPAWIAKKARPQLGEKRDPRFIERLAVVFEAPHPAERPQGVEADDLRVEDRLGRWPDVV